MTASIDTVAAIAPIEPPSRLVNDAVASAAAKPTASSEAKPSATPVAASSAPVAAPPESPTRLLVEPGKGSQTYVYKLVDRSTGEVLSEFPRQTADILANKPDYSAGAVVDESA